ncbi:MAG: hypothetical protein AAB875_04160 [Patescibacteria group bacterium]
MAKNFLFGSEISTSPSGKFNLVDAKKTLRHIVVIAAGAGTAEVFNLLTAYITGHNFGQFQFLISLVVSSGLLEMARRWVADHLVE